MKPENLEKLKYPIGKFNWPEKIREDQTRIWIKEIELFPTRLIELIKELSENELNWKYRPDGWTIKQVVHHCADSHMNSFIRFKLSLTEDTPTIKPYFEDKWAELPDTTDSNISESIKILEGLHSRWTILLKSLKSEDLKREFIHPEHGKHISLGQNNALYAWHCNHHFAHIKQAIENKGNY
jgi:hypothetical protein